jgi:putative FmdB family regulatory protein
MPIYEYRCAKCGADFEEIVGMNAPAPACPECHSGKTEKLLSKACFRSSWAGGDYSQMVAAPSSSSGCSGCAGGNCSSCH